MANDKKITDYTFKDRFRYFCRKEKNHTKKGLLWALEVKENFRSCNHKLGKEKHYLTMCVLCKTHFTKSAVCLLRDLDELNDKQRDELFKELSS